MEWKTKGVELNGCTPSLSKSDKLCTCDSVVVLMIGSLIGAMDHND